LCGENKVRQAMFILGLAFLNQLESQQADFYRLPSPNRTFVWRVNIKSILYDFNGNVVISCSLPNIFNS
jgi:hypothetical protein